MSRPFARRHLLGAASLAFGIVAATPAAAVTTVIYDFITTRNGAAHFLDSFNDGLAPPSAPNFANGTLASYFVAGTFSSGDESGGRLRVDSLQGIATTNALLQASRTQRATLQSNADPSNTTNGLKPNMAFAVSSLADIALASGPGSFGVRLSDRNDTGSVSYLAEVGYLPATHSVRLRVQDFVAHTIVDVSSIIAPAAADKVRLSLVHPVAGDAHVFATAEFFHAGESMGVYNVPGATTIFNRNQFARAEFAAGETLPVPEPETYAMMMVGLGLVGWQLRRKAKAARGMHLV